MNDGDWICGDANCGNINFARRAACYRCNKERPDGGKPSKKKLGIEIGKSAAEKSRGLFNADDWQCNKCANVNWARRHTCNVCNAPKFGEVEARTGYGGGYNERGVVEYRRREPSSDDEYDEFGRKKRKRKSEAQDKVGITEGPVNKKLPPTALQKDIKKDHVMPVPAPNSTYNINRGREKVSGSLSDGSVCDLPPLTKVAFRRNQLQTQTNYYKQEHMQPSFKSNMNASRKRFSSIGDRDHTGSSGYETGSKKKNEVPVVKTYNPVMENRVTSTNNDVVYKFTGPTPAEDFQVTYTVEERVRAAAFAIVHNNCKISTTKFESLYDKPAPDFKTIFGWRQRLLTTGCLVDAHLELHKKEIHNEINTTKNKSFADDNIRKKDVQVLPNPDEIPIISDSEDDNSKNVENGNKPLSSLRQRSVSVETLLLGGMESNIRPGGSVSSEERESQVRSHSASTRHRTRSSSRDTQDSNYPETDSENMGLKNIKTRPKKTKNSRSSIHGTDSDSVSYNSDDGDFLSRVYEDGRKIRRKVKRGSTPISKMHNYMANEINGGFQGYSTVQPSEHQSPLVTGNIYTTNLHNMNVKRQESVVLDTDGCSSEYVPTRLGSTAKKNYQEFRDNVKKKGYWAKGNGGTIGTNKSSTITSITIPTAKNVQQPTTQTYFTETVGYVTAPVVNRTEDFTKDEFDNFSSVDYYTPFDKPIKSTTSIEKSPERSIDSSRIFDVVQSNSASKNRSIMDIFNTGDLSNHSPDRDHELEKYANVHKMYETEWDEDDDALYKNTDSIETFSAPRRTPSPPSIGSIRTQSPMSKMLYTTDTEAVQSVDKSNKVNLDFIKDRRDMLLDLLKDFQKGKEQDINKNETDLQPIEREKTIGSNIILNSQSKLFNNVKLLEPEHKSLDTANKIISSEAKSIPLEQEVSKTFSPSKRVHVLDSVTIKPSNIQKFPGVSPNSIINNSNQNQTCISNTISSKLSTQDSNLDVTISKESENTIPNIGQVDFSNLLTGINTNTLLLALQNLQQLQSGSTTDTSKTFESADLEQNNIANSETQEVAVETINLTNDEEWEKESNRDGSIERQLEKLDGSTGDTPFLSDIFDPGPVVMPVNINKKLSINLKFSDDNKTQDQMLHNNDNAPVIGNFKSFALPKPILLNRLKLAIKPSVKKSEGKKKKRRKQGKPSASQEDDAAEEDDEEESGDEADLSKYDLWGSDGEQGNSSTLENAEKVKDSDNSNEGGGGALEQTEKNGKSSTQEAKSSSSRRRSRSSSSSSSSTSSSSSSHSSTQAPKNKYDDFNLNSEREGSPKRRKSRSRSRSPRSRSATSGTRRKSRDSRSAGESRSHESTRDKERSRDRDRRDRSRGSRDDRKERRYSRDGPSNHYGARGRHR